jgi:hypothetical protein
MAEDAKPIPALGGQSLPAHHDSESLSLQLTGIEGAASLTKHSQEHLTGRIQDFTVQVITEARAIEKREHVGKGPPEVTAAHIDEAWWVIRRRIRRARHPVMTISARALQTFGAAGIGVGATVFLGSGSADFLNWGPLLFVGSCLATFAGFLLEALGARGD